MAWIPLMLLIVLDMLPSASSSARNIGGGRRGEPVFGCKPSRRICSYFSVTVFVTIGPASPCKTMRVYAVFEGTLITGPDVLYIVMGQ